MNAMTRFSKGQKIRCTEGRKAGRLATVVGYSRDRAGVRIVFDGLKKVDTLPHRHFTSNTGMAYVDAPPAGGAR